MLSSRHAAALAARPRSGRGWSPLAIARFAAGAVVIEADRYAAYARRIRDLSVLVTALCQLAALAAVLFLYRTRWDRRARFGRDVPTRRTPPPEAPPRRPQLSVVIPAHNEASRLPRSLRAISGFLAGQPALAYEVVVVDNGSTDATDEAVRAAAEVNGRIRSVRIARRGKGHAVRAGVLAARGDVVIFADADLSWPLAALTHFSALIRGGTAIVIGSREGHSAQRIDEPVYRRVMGRVFNGWVRALAVPGIEDTQCGFKAFGEDVARDLFSRQRIGGFAFDVEILYLARSLGYPVEEVPIRWSHDPRSRVRPVRDALSMARDVAMIRLNSMFGRYRGARPVPGVPGGVSGQSVPTAGSAS